MKKQTFYSVTDLVIHFQDSFTIRCKLCPFFETQSKSILSRKCSIASLSREQQAAALAL